MLSRPASGWIRAAACALALLPVGCSEAPPAPPPPLEIPVVEVIQRDQPIVIEMVGQTFGSSDIPIRARVEGVLLGLHFVEGGHVEEGQLLYTIDPSELESKLVEAKAHLAQSNTRLAKSKADLGRIRPLAEMNAVSQVDLDGAQAQYDAGVSSLEAAEARVEQARIELGYTRISSPIAGRISITAARVGEFVGREPNPVVLNFVSRTDPIRVRFSIDERRYLLYARQIRDAEGNAVRKTADGEGVQMILADGTVHPYPGHAVATAAAIDPDTGTFTLEADFPNPDDIVIAGQFARVRAVVDVREDALLIPQRSVSELQGIFRVYVVGDDGKVEMRPVELGTKVGQLQIVESGLRAGEQIAFEIMRLQPGMTIAPKRIELGDAGAPVVPPSDAEPGGDAPAGDEVGA